MCAWLNGGVYVLLFVFVVRMSIYVVPCFDVWTQTLGTPVSADCVVRRDIFLGHLAKGCVVAKD